MDLLALRGAFFIIQCQRLSGEISQPLTIGEYISGPVTEKTPAHPQLVGGVKVKLGGDDTLACAVGFCNDLAGRVGDE